MPYDGSKFFEDKSTLKLSKTPTARLRGLAGVVMLKVFGLAPQSFYEYRPIRGVPLELQVLNIARAAICHESNWVQRRYETLNGRRCAVGALRYATKYLGLKHTPEGAHNALMAVALSRGFQGIEKMNDNSTHAEVISAFDEACGILMRRC